MSWHSKSHRFALYLGSLDRIGFGGQFRYIVDLIQGLFEAEAAAHFLVLGSCPTPDKEFESVFRSKPDTWRYRCLAPLKGRGSFYREQLRLAVLLCKERVNLCHSLDGGLPLLASCPVVTTIHDTMYELFPEYTEVVRSRPYRILRWAMRRRARRIICISQTTADDLCRLWKVNRSRIDVIPHGTRFIPSVRTVDDEVPLPKALQVVSTSCTITSPYNLEPRKNLSTLLEAVARLRSKYSDLSLVLFGQAAVTPERERHFQEHIHRLDLTASIVLTGRLEDEQLAWLYRHATLFVFPSLYEGFGYPVLEAMSLGACVIVRDASAMAEVVGDAGVCLETADPKVLAAGMDVLLADSGRRASLGKAASQRAASFTIERMAQSYLDAYWKALCTNEICERPF